MRLRFPRGGGARTVGLLIALLAGPHVLLAAPVSELPAAYRAWLEEVSLLITDKELEGFSTLRRDYQRNAFIERFWQVRDPFPETGENEFREAWKKRLELAHERFGDLDSDPARTILLVGPPQQILSNLCPELLRPLEAWLYRRSDTAPGGIYLVFVSRSGLSRRSLVHWAPSEGLESLLDWTLGPIRPQDDLQRDISRRCIRGRQLKEVLDRAVDFRHLEATVELVPRPSDEWVDVFLDRTTALIDGTATLDASLRLDYPGRYQSRTVVQGLLTVSRDLAEASDAQTPAYNFRVDGEVLRHGELFERFRYRFDLPAEEIVGDYIPLAIQRYLRPSDYTLILELEDLNSGRLFRSEQPIQVPAVPAQRPASAPLADAAPQTEPPAQLAEANAVLSAGDYLVTLLPPPDRLVTGNVRIEARAVGTGIAKVSFVLNGRTVMSKTRPPYSVEIDLGRAPRLHTLEAIALDENDRELARDRIPINAGPHRFAVRLLEPKPGKRYIQSLRAYADVDVPEGEKLDRVDFYINDLRLASLFQPPFVQPIVLPQTERITYVRAVAYLVDGNSTEDLVFINSPDHMDRLRINMVELYTTVSDKRGSPIEGLQRDDFAVLEEGLEQEISRFERVRDLSIHAGIVLDASTSMAEELDEAVKAALRFFDSVLRNKDRAAVVVFNDAPLLKVPFTNNLEVLAGGLADLEAEGETVLYDTLVYTLYYFAGVKGKRALILLSDGQDSRSRHSFDEALEFARRSGVAIYTIGLGLAHREVEVRSLLSRLARDTGGRSFFIAGASELESIYASIEEELRSQYLLAYQSSHEQGGPFRRVEVLVDVPGLKAKTIPGYYP